MRKELLKGLSEEQIKKVEACKSSDEILALAKAEGVQLSDEQLEAVSGGGCSTTVKCSECGSKDIKETEYVETQSPLNGSGKIVVKYKCRKCGHKWE